MKYLLSSIIVFTLFTGCAGKYLQESREYHVSKKYTESSSSLYYLAKDDVKEHAPKTGFYPLENNLDAFMARVTLIENAKKSLDLQYFIYAEDETAISITKLLIDAADRGVHVRVLIDDLLEKNNDITISTLVQHKNIEIKLFNPTSFRKLTGWLQLGLNMDTLGRRMHNKLLIADNSAIVLGGRNIENIYFAADKDNIFIDNDVLAIGPLAAEASNEFETYWNTPISKDITKVSSDSVNYDDFQKLKKAITKTVNSIEYSDYIKEASQREFAQTAKRKEIPLIYGDATLYFDKPTKITMSEEDTSSHLSVHIKPYILNAKKSLKIINPYFIPNDLAIKEISALRKKGVEISILTNSLATNDGIPVYSAYSRYQKELIRLGVHLYELNPHSFSYIYKEQKYRKGKIPRSSLHAKSMIIDDEIFIIGSANLDPRSIKLNTEVVAVIHSKELAKIESTVFAHATKEENVFTLSLKKAQKKKMVATEIPQEEYQVVWSTKKGSKTVHYTNDGDAGFWRRLGSNLSYYIPMDKYL
jgi:putative cardiolipin synthase